MCFRYETRETSTINLYITRTLRTAAFGCKNVSVNDNDVSSRRRFFYYNNRLSATTDYYVPLQRIICGNIIIYCIRYQNSFRAHDRYCFTGTRQPIKA